MLIILSPAKTLDYETAPQTQIKTTPELIDDAARLVGVLKKKSPKQLAALMGVSDPLAELNHARYQDWVHPMPDEATKQAALAFKGDVYLGLQAERMTEKQLVYAQDHLRILSGLYGILRPLDAMLPYRLEMGTALKTRQGKDLYAFWGTKITESLQQQLTATNSRCLLNLASNEYYKSVKAKELDTDVEIIAPVFKDLSKGKYKMISYYAKKARGSMASWVIRNKVKTTNKLIRFDGDGYRYDEASSTPSKPVFLRDAVPE